MSVIANNMLAGAAGQGGADAGYVIPKSLRFNSGDSAHLDKTFASAGNRRTWTWSGWLKRSNFDQYNYFFNARSAATNYFNFTFTDDQLKWYNRPTSGTHRYATSTAVFRDAAAWYHVVIAWNTTESTDSDRVKLYVNGERVTSFSASVWPAQNEEGVINDNLHHEIGAFNSGTQYQYNGLLADVQFVDGQALAPTDFGETRESDGVWVPKEYTFGTNPNNNITWNSTYSAAFAGNAMTDSATVGSFTGLNSSITITLAESVTVESSLELNLYANVGSFSTYTTVSVNGTSQTANMSLVNSTGSNSGVWKVTGFTGTLTSITLGAQNGANNGISRVIVDGFTLLNGAGDNAFHLNFSDSSTNGALGYDSTATVPDLDPKKGMDVITYTGTYARLNVGGLNFEPGLVWIKNRDSGTSAHFLADSVRGGTKVLQSNSDGAENTRSNHILSFNPDGFTLGADGTSNYPTGNSFVAWAWRAGGPAVSNTDGTITSQVSANTDYGFSIVTYTGGTSDATIGHGLGQTPKFYIVKARENSGFTDSWNVYHTSLGESAYIKLQSNAAASTPSTIWNETAPTSTVFSVDANSNANEPNTDYVAYVWSEIPGYSKISSYTGNGSSTGPVIRTGFKVRWLLVKRTDSGSTDNWALYDSERDPANPNVARLFPNLTNAESTNAGNAVDFLGDGFQPKSTSDGTNANNGNYIYIAFADRPGNNWDVNNLVTNEGLSTSKDNFDVVTYTGNGSTQSIDSLEFQPDFVWIKNRGSVEHHSLNDSVRGVNRQLESSRNVAETTHTNQLTSFNANGFTVGSSSQVNQNNVGQVAWCWKAGGTAVSNTDGSITSSVSANPSAGFSIVSFNGTAADGTVGHGLNAKPSLYIVKNRDTTSSWFAFTDVIDGSNDYLYLDTTDAKNDTGANYANVATSSVFYMGIAVSGLNASGDDHIAYCFANVPGYQRIGSYTGNGTSTGPVIVTGFKPRFILFKRTNSARDWEIYDTQRSGDSNTKALYPADPAAEGGNAGPIKINSDGFQPLTNSASTNGSGDTYIYLAIGDDKIGSDEDCLVDVPNAVTADAAATDTTGGYQRGNYATLNPLDSPTNNFGTLTNGNLEFVGSSNAYHSLRATISIPSTGKWYYESTSNGTAYSPRSSGSQYSAIGFVKTNVAISSITDGNSNWLGDNGYGLNFSGTRVDLHGTEIDGGDVVGVAIDRDANTYEYFVNGVSTASGTIGVASGTDLSPFVFVYGSSYTDRTVNFGQMPFKYPMPSGYAALNTTALPAATIADGSDYFETVLWTGDGTNNRKITTPFSPDFVWAKFRNQSFSHGLYDTVRGDDKRLVSNSTAAEGTVSLGMESDGFVVEGSSSYNDNNDSFVAWTWDAGTSTDTNNTDGTITPTGVRANPSAGFSIVTYSVPSSGTTFSVGHGLGAPPSLIIAKDREGSNPWGIYHSALGAGKGLLFSTAGEQVNSNWWNNTNPTSSLFYLNTGIYAHSEPGKDYVAYCFADVAGYSSAFSFTGTGTDPGPFVYLGFKPALIIVKRTDSGNAASHWRMIDMTINPYNVADTLLYANSSASEITEVWGEYDALSNGFRVMTPDSNQNASGGSYVGFAWAEHPFQANGGLAR